MKKPYRIGILGCGSVADFGHIPAIQRIGDLQITAFFDPVPGRAQSYADKFGTGFGTTDIDEFYRSGIDAVCICSPMPVHYENVLRAAKEGVHVLCEKPISQDQDQAEEMIAVMKASGKGFFLGYVYRFSGVSSTLRAWYQEEIIGKVRSIRMIYDWNLHGQWVIDEKGEWIKSPMWEGRMLEGGPMIDCGVHMIDLVRWITGEEVVRVSGHGAWVADYDAPDHVYAHLDLANGIHAMIEMSFTYGHTAKQPQPVFLYEMIGTGGVARFDRNGYLLEARNGEGIHRGEGTGEKNFDGMWSAFSHFLTTGDPGDLALPQDAVIASEIANVVTMQAKEGRSVKLNNPKEIPDSR